MVKIEFLWFIKSINNAVMNFDLEKDYKDYFIKFNQLITGNPYIMLEIYSEDQKFINWIKYNFEFSKIYLNIFNSC